jgi:diphosphomevalonate decarboxylase
MHSLFHTCSEPFSYFEPGTIEAIQWLAPLMQTDEPPIVTLDAGPNVHILVPTEKAEQWRRSLKDRFYQFTVLEDRQGRGAQPL